MAEPRLSLPIYVAASHVRLSAAHAAALFDRPLTPLLPLGETTLVACLETVTVRVGRSQFSLRVVTTPTGTEVRLAANLLRALPESETLHLDGPRGTVVLATEPIPIRRVLALSDDDARALGNPPHANVHVAADRARVFSDVPVERGTSSALWVDAEDLNSLELSPDALALVL